MSNELVTFTEVQSQYNRLYKCLRQYIWEYNVVEHIGELEVLAYTAFADRGELRHALDVLVRDIKATDVWKNDEDLQACVQSFYDLIDQGDVVVPLAAPVIIQ